VGDPIYHITSLAEWEAARIRGVYQAESLQTDGFAHCATGWQVERIARLQFPGRSDLVVLGIDPELLRWDVRWEQTDGGEVFPHVYGPIPASAVISVHSLST
jgi:uncharacterized protein (DUF952 family)